MASDIVVPDSGESKGKFTLGKALLGVGGLIGIAVALPVIWFAFLSTLGLIGIGVLLAIGAVMWKSQDFFGQKMDNYFLGLQLAEARKNPILTMKNNLRFKANQLNVFKTNMKTVKTQIEGLMDTLRGQKAKDPGCDLTNETSAVQKMQEWYKLKMDNYTRALQAYQQYEQAVDRATFKFGFGNAAEAVSKAMNDQDAKKIMQDMLSDEAFRSTNDTFNSAFAQLDLDAAELSAKESMSFGSGNKNFALDTKAIEIPFEQPVTVPVSVNVAQPVKV